MSGYGNSFKKTLVALILALELFALSTQFYLEIKYFRASFFESFILYFSYFTILSNSIVAICCVDLLVSKKSGSDLFFQRNSTVTAATVYILIVGLVYNAFLRPGHLPRDLEIVTNEIFHSIAPALFLMLWIFFVSKEKLEWNFIALWLVFPLVYVFYILILGSIKNAYPYPFLDVIELGYSRALINAFYVLLAFLLISAILIGVGKIIYKSSLRNS